MPFISPIEPTPRSSITLADYRDRVRGDLGDRDNAFITDADLDAWANEAQDKIARKTLWYKKKMFLNTTSGQFEYNIPVRSLQIDYVFFNGLELGETTRHHLQMRNSRWRYAPAGTPTLYYTQGNNIFGLYYPPSVDSVDLLEVHFRGLPTKIIRPDDQFYVPYGGEELFITYGKLKASEKDAANEGTFRLSMYQGEWQQGLRELKAQVDAFDENEVTVMGEDALYLDQPFLRVWDFTTPITTV